MESLISRFPGNKKILELGAIDEQVPIKLLEMYLVNSEKHLDTINKNSVNRNDAKIKSAAHILKSISGNLGFEEIEALCLLLENANTWDQNLLTSFTGRLNEKIHSLQRSIQEFLNGRGNLSQESTVKLH